MEKELFDAVESAAYLGISKRSLWRLRDSGRMPAPVRLGRCVRWRRRELEQWVAEGCPPVRRAGR